MNPSLSNYYKANFARARKSYMERKQGPISPTVLKGVSSSIRKLYLLAPARSTGDKIPPLRIQSGYLLFSLPCLGLDLAFQ